MKLKQYFNETKLQFYTYRFFVYIDQKCLKINDLSLLQLKEFILKKVENLKFILIKNNCIIFESKNDVSKNIEKIKCVINVEFIRVKLKSFKLN